MRTHNHKSFQTGERIYLPVSTTKYNVDNKTLLIASEIPSWLVLNDTESHMYNLLDEGLTIRQAMEKYECSFQTDKNSIINLTTKLLEKIENRNFYKTSEIGMISSTPERKLFHLYLTHNCNLKCIHCYMNAGKKLDQELRFNQWRQIIDEITNKIGQTNFTLSGGEPLLYKELRKLIRYIKTSGHSVMLLTNGTLIVNQQIADEIADCVDNLQISVDGASQVSNDYIRGRGSFERIVKAIHLLVKTGMKIELSIQATPDNINDLEVNLGHFVQSFNYQKFELRINYKLLKQGRAENLPSSYFDFEDTGKFRISKLLSELESLGCFIKPLNHNFGNNNSNCGIGGGLCIDSNGDVYPCTEIYFKIGNYFKDGLNYLLSKSDELNEKTSVDKMEPCDLCDLILICKGGCRLDNHRRFGDMLKPICDQYKKNNILHDLVNIYYR